MKMFLKLKNIWKKYLMTKFYFKFLELKVINILHNIWAKFIVHNLGVI